MNQNEHIALWLIIIEYYTRTVTDETVDMYSKQTASTGISAEDLEKAFNVWCLNPEKCDRFPLPGNLIALVTGHGSSRSAADQIANDVLSAMKCYSAAYGFSMPCGSAEVYPTFPLYVRGEFGALTFEVISRWGGPQYLAQELNSTPSFSTVRAQLRDLAQSLMDAPNASHQLSPAMALQGSQPSKPKISPHEILTALLKKTVKNTSL